MNKKSYLSLALVTLISTSGMQAGLLNDVLEYAAHPSRAASQTSLMDVYNFFTKSSVQSATQATLNKVPGGSKVVTLGQTLGSYGHALVTIVSAVALARLTYMNKDKINDKVVKPAQKQAKRFVGLES